MCLSPDSLALLAYSFHAPSAAAVRIKQQAKTDVMNSAIVNLKRKQVCIFLKKVWYVILEDKIQHGYFGGFKQATLITYLSHNQKDSLVVGE